MATESFCLTVTDPTTADTVMVAVLALATGVPERVAVPSWLSVKVSPFCLAADKVVDRAADELVVVMVKLPAAFKVKLAVVPEVKASALTVSTWVVSGPTPLLAWIVMVNVPPTVGAAPLTVAVPALDLVPGVKVAHDGTPVALTVAVGDPDVVTVKFTFLPAAMLMELAEVMTAEFDEGVTLLDVAPSELPLALVATTVKV